MRHVSTDKKSDRRQSKSDKRKSDQRNQERDRSQVKSDKNGSDAWTIEDRRHHFESYSCSAINGHKELQLTYKNKMNWFVYKEYGITLCISP